MGRVWPTYGAFHPPEKGGPYDNYPSFLLGRGSVEAWYRLLHLRQPPGWTFYRILTYLFLKSLKILQRDTWEKEVDRERGLPSWDLFLSSSLKSPPYVQWWQGRGSNTVQSVSPQCLSHKSGKKLLHQSISCLHSLMLFNVPIKHSLSYCRFIDIAYVWYKCRLAKKEV